MKKKSSMVRASVIAAILLGAFVSHVWWATRAWTMPGMSGHVFRQAQTALTIQVMKEEGFRLDYATPVLGKPWSIPFEFPIYQWLVAKLSTYSGLSVVEAGRGISLVSFYLMLPGLWRLLRAAGLSRNAAALAIVPVLFCPVYLLYGRAVLIETTALCASVWFLAFLYRYHLNRRSAFLAGALACGLVAVLVKSTTWAVACIPWAGWLAADIWRARKAGWRALLVVADEIVLLAVPLLVVGLGWVWITDRLKELNPVAVFLRSDQLSAFNFGTWAQRTDAAVWRGLMSNWTSAVMPWWGLLAALGVVICTSGRARIIAGLGLAAFVGAQLVLFNLYWQHDYYFCANAVGACIAVGCGAAALWENPGSNGWRQWLAVIFLGLVCAGQFATYRQNFFKLQTSLNAGESGLTSAIKDLTKPNEVIVMHSPFWSAETAFWSHRRMMTIPDSAMFLHPEAVERGVAQLGDESVPLVIFSGESRFHSEWIIQRIQDFDLEPVPLFTWNDEVVVYAAHQHYGAMRAALQHARYAGVSLYSGRNAAELSEPVLLSGTPEGEAMTNLSPLPLRGSFPYGVKFYGLDGKKQLFMHSPTSLEFAIPAGAKSVEIGYRIAPAAYERKEFDGVELRVAVREGERETTLFKTNLLPSGNRAVRHTRIHLRDHAKGTLIISTLPGPHNNASYDWALLDYLRIH